MKKYSVDPDTANEAIHSAYESICGKNPDRLAKYWFVSACNVLHDIFKRQKKHISFEDRDFEAFYKPCHQQHAFPTREEIAIETLTKKLKGPDKLLFDMSRKGRSTHYIMDKLNIDSSAAKVRKNRLIKKCRDLLSAAVLLLVFSTVAISQVSVTATQGTGYYLQTADGDTLQLRGATPFYNAYRTALTDALNYSGDHQVQVYVRSNMDERVNADFGYYDAPEFIEIIDTVYIEVPGEIVRDTVYLDQAGELPLVQGFEAGLEHKEDGFTIIDSYAFTQADSLHIYFDCDPDREPLPRYVYGKGSRVIHDSFGTQCVTDMDATYHFFASGDTTTVQEYWPLWVMQGEPPASEGIYTDFANYENSLAEQAQWEPFWGNLEYIVENYTLILDLIERNIARLQWTEVPVHRNIQYTITESLHVSHSTGAHAGGRHSEQAQQESVETYIHAEGLGISIFSNGSWSNPHTFPFQWNSGDTVVYSVKIIEDTISAKIWHDGQEEPDNWMEYTNDIIGSVPAGRFAIGSTGAGLYLIHDIGVQVLDD